MLRKNFIIVIFFVFAETLFAQVNAGQDITISAGIPLHLSALYEGYTGIPVTAEDDYFVGPFNIGFDFVFYGETHNQFAIGPNGLVSFDVPAIVNSAPYWKEAPIPNPYFAKTIMGPYQDLFKRPAAPHDQYIYYLTVGEAPNRKLIVGWCEAPMFSCENQSVTIQVVLNEADSTIVNHLIEKPACEANLSNKATHGLNFNDNIGVAVPGRNNTSWTAFHESWKFTPAGTNNYTVDSFAFNPEVIVPQGKIAYAWYKDAYPGGELISSEKTVDIHPMESTTYYAEITLCGGLKYVDDIFVKVIPIPNAFNPNSPVDQNRTFRFFANPSDEITNYRMLIYNRWGQQVFESTDVNEGWDGTNNGTPCNSGVYVWVVYYNGGKGEITNKGSVTLVR